MKTILIVVLAALVTGCASSSGVLKMNADTYSVTASASPGRGGAGAAKKMAYDEAIAECAKQSKEFLVVSENATRPSWTDGMHTVELNFRCTR